jgi:hypothetical protein
MQRAPPSQMLKYTLAFVNEQVFTQQEFAKNILGILAGLDPFGASTRIDRYEQDVHATDQATAMRLAKTLGVPLAYLYADTERHARMIRAFSVLDAAEQEQLLKGD